jgi:hypothetical protein
MIQIGLGPCSGGGCESPKKIFPLDAFLGRLKSVGKGNVLQLDESVKEVNHLRFICSLQNVILVRGYMRFEFCFVT